MAERLTQKLAGAVDKPISKIPKSERELAELEGKMAFVKVSYPDDQSSGEYNQGWYLFEVADGGDVFLRQDPGDPLFIDRKTELRMHHQFDRNLGVILNSFYYGYQPIHQSTQPELFEETKQKLIDAGASWREPEK